MKRVAVLQSNYVPWKGYFDILHDVDLFVFYDDVQYTTNDWRNRNRIKTAAGLQWLTIPVGKHMHRLVSDVELPRDAAWARTHWCRLEAAYHRAPCFRLYREYVRELYLGRRWTTLSEMNQSTIAGIARDLLGLSTRIERSSDYGVTGTGATRLLALLKAVGADEYVSGPAARAYISEEEFSSAGVRVIWKDYAGYPEYTQLHGPFCHEVSILDTLFHTGTETPWHIWGWRETMARKAIA
jgi:hypothetical protein